MKTQVTYVDEGIASFLTSFYTISDTPGNNDDYVASFQKDALFVVGGKQNKGSDGGFFLVPTSFFFIAAA